MSERRFDHLTGCVCPFRRPVLVRMRPIIGRALTLAAVMTFDPDLDRLPETLSPTLKTYLIRCLEKDPRERLRDIGDVRLAMQGVFETGVATPRRRFNVPRSWRDVLRVETPWRTAAP